MSRVHISALILSVWSLHALQRLVWVLLRVVCFPPIVHPHVDQVDWDYVQVRASPPCQTLTISPRRSLTSHQGSLIRFCPMYASMRPRNPVFAAADSKWLFLSIRGICFFNSVFRSNPRVCCKQTLGQNQDRWPSKTTGMQSLHLAPHTEQKQNRNIDGNWPEDQAKEWNWNIEPTWTSFYYWGYDKNLRVSAHAAMFSLCYTMHKSSLLSLLFSLQGVALGLSYTDII